MRNNGINNIFYTFLFMYKWRNKADLNTFTHFNANKGNT